MPLDQVNNPWKPVFTIAVVHGVEKGQGVDLAAGSKTQIDAKCREKTRFFAQFRIVSRKTLGFTKNDMIYTKFHIFL